MPAIDVSQIGRRVLVATHRRSGTHLLIDLLRRQFAATCARKAFGERTDSLYLTLERLDSVGVDGTRSNQPALTPEQALGLLHRARRPILKTHGLPTFADWSPNTQKLIRELRRAADTIYVHRDARDVLCSLYMYMKGFSPSAQVPISEFLRQTVEGRNRVQVWADHVRAWQNVEGVVMLDFSEIVRQTRDVLLRIGSLLGLRPELVEPLLPARTRTIWHARWQRLISRSPGSTAIVTSGSVAQQKLNWRTAFDRQDRKFIWENAGDLMLELGYEDSAQWVDQRQV